MRKAIIAVVGAGHADPELDRLASEVGRLIAESGSILLSGGRGGVMESASRGCREAGGLAVGILPGTDQAEANPYIDVPIATGLGEMRNLLVVRASDALIAVGGGYGTLSEIALAHKTGKPVIGLSTWEFSEKTLAARDPADAVGKALGALKAPGRGKG
ncbi:MAG: TIGR00725 family protein [Thermodesulfobacteriota bacterium]